METRSQYHKGLLEDCSDLSSIWLMHKNLANPIRSKDLEFVLSLKENYEVYSISMI